MQEDSLLDFNRKIKRRLQNRRGNSSSLARFSIIPALKRWLCHWAELPSSACSIGMAADRQQLQAFSSPERWRRCAGAAKGVESLSYGGAGGSIG